MEAEFHAAQRWCGPDSLLDTLHDAGHNKKQTMALLLYQMRLQKLYDLLPVREEQL